MSEYCMPPLGGYSNGECAMNRINAQPERRPCVCSVSYTHLRKADLDDRLYRMYDKIEDEESQMIEARAKRQAIEAEKLTGDNIYKVLMYFDKLYSAMNDVERRRVMETLISEIQIYEDRQPNGQWLKSIKFKLPIIEEDMEISLDNDTHVETVARLERS